MNKFSKIILAIICVGVIVSGVFDIMDSFGDEPTTSYEA